MSKMERTTIRQTCWSSFHYRTIVRTRVDDTWGSVVSVSRLARFHRVVIVDVRGREHTFTCCGTHPAWIAWDASPRAVATITAIRLARRAREEAAAARAPPLVIFPRPKAEQGDAP